MRGYELFCLFLFLGGLSRLFEGAVAQCTDDTRPKNLTTTTSISGSVIAYQKNESTCQWKITAPLRQTVRVIITYPFAERCGPCNLTDLVFIDGGRLLGPVLSGECVDGHLVVTSKTNQMFVLLPPAPLEDKADDERLAVFTYRADLCSDLFFQFALSSCREKEKTSESAGNQTECTHDKSAQHLSASMISRKVLVGVQLRVLVNEWKIRAEEGSKIQVELYLVCNSTDITFYDGGSPNSSVLTGNCSDEKLQVSSSCNEMFISLAPAALNEKTAGERLYLFTYRAQPTTALESRQCNFTFVNAVTTKPTTTTTRATTTTTKRNYNYNNNNNNNDDDNSSSSSRSSRPKIYIIVPLVVGCIAAVIAIPWICCRRRFARWCRKAGRVQSNSARSTQQRSRPHNPQRLPGWLFPSPNPNQPHNSESALAQENGPNQNQHRNSRNGTSTNQHRNGIDANGGAYFTYSARFDRNDRRGPRHGRSQQEAFYANTRGRESSGQESDGRVDFGPEWMTQGQFSTTAESHAHRNPLYFPPVSNHPSGALQTTGFPISEHQPRTLLGWLHPSTTDGLDTSESPWSQQVGNGLGGGVEFGEEHSDALTTSSALGEEVGVGVRGKVDPPPSYSSLQIERVETYQPPAGGEPQPPPYMDEMKESHPPA